MANVKKKNRNLRATNKRVRAALLVFIRRFLEASCKSGSEFPPMKVAADLQSFCQGRAHKSGRQRPARGLIRTRCMLNYAPGER